MSTIAALILTAALATSGVAKRSVAHPVAIDPERVTVGSRAFRVMNDGMEDGRTTVVARFTDDALVIHDVSVSAGLGIEEDILIRLDPESFSPRAVDLHGDFNGTHIQGRLRFAEDQVSGHLHMHRPEDGRSTDRAVRVELPPGTLTRGTALHLANAMGPVRVGAPLVFHWFNPLSAQVATITYSLVGRETVTVPAGTFDCDVIRQEGGQPGNLIYVARDDGRIVRFDVIGQPIQLELLPESVL